jgi:transglutaminase/protease-like cytokinesis protein 3
MNARDFRRELKTHYFLTRPEQLLYSHLPSNASWQLVTNSERVSYDVFVRRPKIWSTYFNLQLQVVEPQNSPELIFDRKRGLTELLIRAPIDVIISSSLEINNIKTLKEQSFTQFLHERQVWQCLFIPQRHGRHTVTIFGRRQNSSDNGECAIQFHFNAPLYRPVKHTIFPKTYSNFSTDKCELFEPLEGQLKEGSQVTIHCRVVDATSVRLILDENDWLSEDGYDKITGHFKRTITVPKKKITLNVKDKKASNYTTLLLYTVI